MRARAHTHTHTHTPFYMSVALKLALAQTVLQAVPGRHMWNHCHSAEAETEARGFSSGAEAPECETPLLRAGFNLILADQLCQKPKENEIRGKSPG